MGQALLVHQAKYIFELQTLNANGVSGALVFSSGVSSSGASGSISIGTGTAAGGEGGDISLNVGTSSTTAGGAVSLGAGSTGADGANGENVVIKVEAQIQQIAQPRVVK